MVLVFLHFAAFLRCLQRQSADLHHGLLGPRIDGFDFAVGLETGEEMLKDERQGRTHRNAREGLTEGDDLLSRCLSSVNVQHLRLRRAENYVSFVSSLTLHKPVVVPYGYLHLSQLIVWYSPPLTCGP